MGLSIAYQLGLPAETPRHEVIERVERLRAWAAALPFTLVTELFEGDADPPGDRHEGAITAQGWFRSWAHLTVATDEELEGGAEPGRALDAIGFVVFPGEQCEPVALGMVWAPRRDESWSPLPDQSSEWRWLSVCKTQYASVVSEEHFVRCHTAVISLLDQAARLGFSVAVTDESGYWESRDADQLVAQVQKMNRLVARLGGALHDALGDEHKVVGPIFDHPDFERLETEPLPPPV